MIEMPVRSLMIIIHVKGNVTDQRPSNKILLACFFIYDVP